MVQLVRTIGVLSVQTPLFLYFVAPSSLYYVSEASLDQTAGREIIFVAAKRLYVTFQSFSGQSSYLCSSIHDISYSHSL